MRSNPAFVPLGMKHSRGKNSAPRRTSALRVGIWIAASLLAMVALISAIAVAWKSFRSERTQVTAQNPAPAPANNASSSTAFATTVENTFPRPTKAPAGMVWIPGGEFSMGAQDPPEMNDVGMQATRDSRPIHRVYVDAFWMDKNDVTNAEFARFVRATGYKTVSESKPRAEDFPGAPPENLVAGAGLRKVGWQAFAHRSGVGICRTGRTHRQAVCVGRRISPEAKVDGQHVPRTVSRSRQRRRWPRGAGCNRTVPAE
jgi:formylglycine-generating enzyme required for sulfatase activity